MNNFNIKPITSGQVKSKLTSSIKGASNFVDKVADAASSPEGTRAITGTGEKMASAFITSLTTSLSKSFIKQVSTGNRAFDSMSESLVKSIVGSVTKALNQQVGRAAESAQRPVGNAIRSAAGLPPRMEIDQEAHIYPNSYQGWYSRVMTSPLLGMMAYQGLSSTLSGFGSAIGAGQNSLIGTSMLQNQLSRSATRDNYIGWNKSLIAPGKARGYLDQDSLTAAASYMPFARRSSISDMGAMAGFASSYGQDYAAWGGSMGDAARLGLVGQGGNAVNRYQSILAGSYGAIRNPAAKMGDYTSGIQDFARIMASNTVSTPGMTGAHGGLSTWMSMYQGLNKMGPLTSGTAGAALLAQANQGIVNGGNGSVSTQLAYYQALGGPGGISPSALQYIKEGGLTGNTFQKLTGWANKNYAGFSKSDRLMATSNLFGVNMHQMQALQQAASQHGGMLSTKQINAILHPGQTPADFTRTGQNAPANTTTGWTKTINDFVTHIQNATGFLGPFGDALKGIAFYYTGTHLLPKIPAVVGPKVTGAATTAAGRVAASRVGQSAFGRIAGKVLPTIGKGASVWGAATTAAQARNWIEGTFGAGDWASQHGWHQQAAGQGIYGANIPVLSGLLGMTADIGGDVYWKHKGQANFGDWLQTHFGSNAATQHMALGGLFSNTDQFAGNVLNMPVGGLENLFGWGKSKGKGGGGSGYFIKSSATGHLGKLGDIYTRHLDAANKDEQDIVASILNTHAPLLPRAQQQITDILTKTKSVFGDALVSWLRSAVSSVGGTGGTGGNPSGGGDPAGGSVGDTYGSNTFSGFSIAQRQGTNIGRTSALADDIEAGNVYNVGVGNKVRLPQGARYNAKYSTKYNSMFTLPNGKTLSIMHIDAQRFKNNQYVSAGTVIGTATTAARGVNGGTYGDTNSSGFRFNESSDPGVVEADLYDNPAHAAARSQQGQLNLQNWLNSLRKVHTGGAGGGTGWQAQLLKKLGVPVSAGNLAFMTAWAKREGTSAKFNPLATTMHEPGSTAFNSTGVQNFSSMSSGVAAMASTLESSYYKDIIRQLSSGNIQPGQTVTSSDFLTWSGHGYNHIDTSGAGGGSGGFVGGGKALRVTIDPLTITLKMPDGSHQSITVHPKVKYNGVAGVHVNKNHGHLAHPANKGHVRR